MDHQSNPPFDAADTLVVPVWRDFDVPNDLQQEVSVTDLGAIAARFNLQTPSDHLWVPNLQGPDVMLVRVDERLGPAPTAKHAREASMAAARQRSGAVVVNALGVTQSGGEFAAAVAEGWTLGSYQFARPNAVADSPESRVSFWPAMPRATERGVIIGEATNLARDLVNTPAAELVPMQLADVCRELANHHNLSVHIHTRADLLNGGFGGILGVGQGSSHSPVLVEIRRGHPSAPHVALVAKGITFDSGGLSLKSTHGMQSMKADMAGAAAVIGALVALDRLGSDIPVRAYLACAENMIGPNALRVGDVLQIADGQTVEVTDTDCEGRLVMADALALAASNEPTEIIDIATLTSSSGIGPDIWAAFGTELTLIEAIVQAGRDAGEPGWHMPLWDPYFVGLKSDVASMRNYDPEAKQQFGSITAALFLQQFTCGLPWVHIDLGLTVMLDAPNRHWGRGANGNGTRTLIQYLIQRERHRFR